jgi:hypothetical protein
MFSGPRLADDFERFEFRTAAARRNKSSKSCRSFKCCFPIAWFVLGTATLHSFDACSRIGESAGTRSKNVSKDETRSLSKCMRFMAD